MADGPELVELVGHVVLHLEVLAGDVPAAAVLRAQGDPPRGDQVGDLLRHRGGRLVEGLALQRDVVDEEVGVEDPVAQVERLLDLNQPRAARRADDAERDDDSRRQQPQQHAAQLHSAALLGALLLCGLFLHRRALWRGARRLRSGPGLAPGPRASRPAPEQQDVLPLLSGRARPGRRSFPDGSRRLRLFLLFRLFRLFVRFHRLGAAGSRSRYISGGDQPVRLVRSAVNHDAMRRLGLLHRILRPPSAARSRFRHGCHPLFSIFNGHPSSILQSDSLYHTSFQGGMQGFFAADSKVDRRDNKKTFRRARFFHASKA